MKFNLVQAALLAFLFVTLQPAIAGAAESPGVVGGSGTMMKQEGGGSADPAGDEQPEQRELSFQIAPPLTIRTQNVVFVTSQTYSGDLGGLDGADKKCQDSANAAGMVGRFQAWLSANGGNGRNNPIGRFNVDTCCPWVTTTGHVIAHSWQDILSGNLVGDIENTEYGEFISGGVWTGTTSDISVDGPHDCSGWTTNNFSGTSGVNYIREGWQWTDSDIYACHVKFHLYCFQQADY